MQTMDDALYDLFMRKVIDGDTAVTYAQEPVSMNRKVNLDAGSSFDTGFDGGFHAGCVSIINGSDVSGKFLDDPDLI